MFTGRGLPFYDPLFTGRGLPFYDPLLFGRGLPFYPPLGPPLPLLFGRGLPFYPPLGPPLDELFPHVCQLLLNEYCPSSLPLFFLVLLEMESWMEIKRMMSFYIIFIISPDFLI